jgi:exodeoxyribonuclease V alpha subunit
LGFVVAIDTNNEEILVLYPNEGYIAIYDYSEARAFLDLAYALTVHKTQGAEFKRVAVIISISHLYQMLSGRLLYTAITRAKDEVALIGESYAFEAACKKLDNKPRKTLLVELLSQNQRRTKRIAILENMQKE